MTKPFITELNCKTGESIDRPMTDAEFADFQALQAEKLADENKKEIDLAAKESAQAKLSALGLTPDDLKALGL